MIPILFSSEVIEEHNSEDGAIQRIERRCKLNVDAPYILKKVLLIRKHVNLALESFKCLQKFAKQLTQ